MTPLGELRAALPLAILSYEMDWPTALVLSVGGNLVPVPFVVFALQVVGARVERWDNLVGALLRWRRHRIERTWGQRLRRYGFLGIVLLVAIPLPFTGAWTGAFAVWAMDVPVRRGFPAIVIGVGIAGVLVTILTVVGIELTDRLV